MQYRVTVEDEEKLMDMKTPPQCIKQENRVTEHLFNPVFV